jgi:hypothetical protein
LEKQLEQTNIKTNTIESKIEKIEIKNIELIRNEMNYLKEQNLIKNKKEDKIIELKNSLNKI